MLRKSLHFQILSIPNTPYLIAFILLIVGLRFGGFYGFYINADGKGYYAYLPATFIYHDFNFEFIKHTEPKYYPEGAITDFRVDVNGKKVDRDFAGLALLWLPFFLVAHFLSLIFHLPADGYAPIYQYFILFAAVFYLCIGLIFLRKLLLAYNFSEKTSAIIQILIVFATPVIFYTIHNPDYTHAYSFTLITIFIYLVKQFFDYKQNKHLMLSFVLFGLIILVRPVNGMVVLSLPFLAGNMSLLKNNVIYALHQLKPLLTGFFLFLLILFIQLIFYYLETGRWLIYSYDTGFNFKSFHLFDALFSYEKGFFVYTPLAFIALLGFIPLFRKNKFEGIGLLIFLIFVVYIISSWRWWWYAMCFGYRPMTEYLPFFAILLGYSFQLNMGTFLRLVYRLVLTFTVLYNSVLLYQYTHYILDWDTMNKEDFWRVFFRTSSEYQGVLWTSPEPIFEKRPDNVKSDTLAVFDFEKSNLEHITDKTTHSGKYSMLLYKNNRHSAGINDSCKNVINTDSARFYVSAYICPLNRFYSRSLHLIFSIQDSLHFFQYQKIDLDLYHLRTGEWVKIGRTIQTGAIRSPNDILKIHLHNTSNFKVCVDDLIIERLH